MDPATRTALERAKARLDRLALYPRPVSLPHVRVLVVPWLFRLPWFRRFDGYAAHWTILLRRPLRGGDDDLLVHELCHVWQMQHRPVRMPLSYVLLGYRENPYELAARHAVETTRRPLRIAVFLHGTALMHAAAAPVGRDERVAQTRSGEASVTDFASYVPTPGTVEKLRSWIAAGAELVYLSSHRDPAAVAVDESVLRRHRFPAAPVLARRPDESYRDVAARAEPDVLVEDDCESIGADEVTHPQLPPELAARVRSVVVREFGGLEALPDDPLSLLRR